MNREPIMTQKTWTGTFVLRDVFGWKYGCFVAPSTGKDDEPSSLIHPSTLLVSLRLIPCELELMNPTVFAIVWKASESKSLQQYIHSTLIGRGRPCAVVAMEWAKFLFRHSSINELYNIQTSIWANDIENVYRNKQKDKTPFRTCWEISFYLLDGFVGTNDSWVR